jgi:hypothetical protein
MHGDVIHYISDLPMSPAHFDLILSIPVPTVGAPAGDALRRHDVAGVRHLSRARATPA